MEFLLGLDVARQLVHILSKIESENCIFSSRSPNNRPVCFLWCCYRHAKILLVTIVHFFLVTIVHFFWRSHVGFSFILWIWQVVEHKYVFFLPSILGTYLILLGVFLVQTPAALSWRLFLALSEIGWCTRINFLNRSSMGFFFLICVIFRERLNSTTRKDAWSTWRKGN